MLFSPGILDTFALNNNTRRRCDLVRRQLGTSVALCLLFTLLMNALLGRAIVHPLLTVIIIIIIIIVIITFLI